jgi:hypothetical protein
MSEQFPKLSKLLEQQFQQGAEKPQSPLGSLFSLYQPPLGNANNPWPQAINAIANLPVKRKVFVSYHHKGDQFWYNEFIRLFGGKYDILFDNSLQRKIDSDNTDYVDRQIREKHIVGTSITIVLCGAETGKRKYVDWEINSTLHHGHALLGICLPTNPVTIEQKHMTPNRYYTQWANGYAHWIHWTTDPVILKYAIENAITRSTQKSLIDNTALKMTRNLPS